ncbi:hypothetical protein ACOSP7_022296 [Xanthoceras sorbifolium]
MSFEVGPSKSPSALSSSSSSSSSNPEEELDFTAAIEAQNQVTYAEHRTILNVYANNYLLIAYYLNQEDNDQPCHRGSIPGYKVIHRGREEAKHNLWDDYFTKNPQYNYLQKIIVVFQMLAYGVLTDSTDEYIKIEESIAIESMKRFCRAVMKVFGEHYLRSPNADDVARESRLYALDMKKIVQRLSMTPLAHYVIQGKEYNTGYYLADGIYPKWSTLVQTIHDPRGPKKKLSTMKQEACRKDVELAFRVLQS